MSNYCSGTHVIEVLNLNEGEVVQQSLLLVKGRVRPLCSSTIQQLCATLSLKVINSDDCPTHNSPTIATEQLAQISAAGEFKLLFDLESNLNLEETIIPLEKTYTILLRYCDVEFQFIFLYKSRLSHYRLQSLYLLCKDIPATLDELNASCEVVDLNLRLVQCIYSDKLRAAGFPNCTFTLNGCCKVFRTQLTSAVAHRSSENELWHYFAKEILSSNIWGQQINLKFVAFIGCTQYDGKRVAASGDYSYANIRHHLKGNAALGGGGLALFGTGYFYAWPRFFNEIGDCIRSTKRVDLSRFPDESNYRRTYGGVYASTLGAVCHEIGHCFDLGHTEDGVMGQGFDYLNRVLTVDVCIEILPRRIVCQNKVKNQISTFRPRFTQLKPLEDRSRNTFLNKYYEQRENDYFYFTRNCAVILAQSKWLHVDQLPPIQNERSASTPTAAPRVQLASATGEIISSVPLRLIELRCNLNSLVAHYIEFTSDKDYRFKLPQSLWDLVTIHNSHYIFVLTKDGETKHLTNTK